MAEKNDGAKAGIPPDHNTENGTPHNSKPPGKRIETDYSEKGMLEQRKQRALIDLGQIRWVAGNDLLRQIKFIDYLFDLAA